MKAIVTHGTGNKHTCAGCDTRFFDLNKQSASCPKCGQKVPVIAKVATRPRRSASGGNAEANNYSSHISAASVPERKSQAVKRK